MHNGEMFGGVMEASTLTMIFEEQTLGTVAMPAITVGTRPARPGPHLVCVASTDIPLTILATYEPTASKR